MTTSGRRNVNIEVKVRCLLAAILLTGSNRGAEYAARRQRGTFTGSNLCKTGSGGDVTRSRSSVECFVRCLGASGGSRRSVKYLREEGSCHCFDEGLVYDFYEVQGDECAGYDVFAGCPKGFTHVTECNKCWYLDTVARDWTTARDQCNRRNRKSHPIIMDSRQSVVYSSKFVLDNENHTKCENFLDKSLFSFWTAGRSPYRGKTRMPFQWMPFPNVTTPLGTAMPWGPGEPNSASDGRENCIQSYVNGGLDDYLCTRPFCVLCEVDAN